MDKESKIILIKDLIDNKQQKEKELEFYKKKLQNLIHRVTILQHDINITNEIIRIIEQEQVIEVNPN